MNKVYLSTNGKVRKILLFVLIILIITFLLSLIASFRVSYLLFLSLVGLIIFFSIQEYFFQDVYIKNELIIIENIFVLRKYSYKKTDFIYFEKLNFSNTIYKISLSDGRSYIFTTNYYSVLLFTIAFPNSFSTKIDNTIKKFEFLVKKKFGQSSS